MAETLAQDPDVPGPKTNWVYLFRESNCRRIALQKECARLRRFRDAFVAWHECIDSTGDEDRMGHLAAAQQCRDSWAALEAALAEPEGE